MAFSSRIQVAAGEREVDAKSLLSVLSLGAKGGTTLRLRAEGTTPQAPSPRSPSSWPASASSRSTSATSRAQ